MTKIVYHCTWTELLPRITCEGLRVMQTSNWVDGDGKRRGRGEIYAFENEWDAIRWAAKMDWEHARGHGTGKISILTLDDAGEWDQDFNDPLSQAASEGRWLKTFRAIPADAIVAIRPLTRGMVKRLTAHMRDRFGALEAK
jgi:hypothetical protein